MTQNLPARRHTGVDLHAPRAVPVAGTGQNIVPGSNGIAVITIKVTSYGDQSREEAEDYLWRLWSGRLRGAFVQVVHADDPSWEVIL